MDEAADVARGSIPPEEKKNEALTRRAVRGAIWTIATSLGSRAVGLVGTLLITRFLDPETYGDASLAAIVVLTTHTFTSCGINQYLVAKPNEGKSAAFHASFYFLLLGVLGLCVTVLFRDSLGAWTNAPDIAHYIPGLAIAALCERFAVLQDAIQVRQMRFRSLSLQRSMGEVLYAIVTLTLAWAGYGGYSLVWGSVARSGSRLISLSFTTEREEWLRPCRITWKRTRELFAFGLPMSVAHSAGFGSRKWDNVLINMFFGSGTQGVYNLAYQMADLPATQIGETIGDVLVPSFAQMDSDERRKKALGLALRVMTLIVAPLAIGLGFVAPELVRTFFNSRWSTRSIGVMMVILSALSVVRPIGWVAGSYLQVKDRPRIIMVLEVGKTAGLLLLIYAMAHLGETAGFAHVVGALGIHSTHLAVYTACTAVGVAFAISAISYLFAIRRVDGTSVLGLLVPLLPPVLACLPMAAAVYGVSRLVLRFHPTNLPFSHHPLMLCVEVLTGILSFIPSAFVIAPGATKDLLTLLRAARERRRGRAAPEAPAEKAA